ncbi:hypothetical protein Hte_008247 [Hypoxylon texense]
MASNTEDQSKGLQFTKIPLHIALGSFWRHKCTDPRDKLYGILGLVEDDIRADIQPNYTLSVLQVYSIALEQGFHSIAAQMSDLLKQPMAFDMVAKTISNQIKLVEPMPRIPGSSGLIDKYFGGTTRVTLGTSHALGSSEFPQHSGIAGMDKMHGLIGAYVWLADGLHETFRLSVEEVQGTRSEAISRLLSKQQRLRMNIGEARLGLSLAFDSIPRQEALIELMEDGKCHEELEQEQASLTAEQFAPHVSGTDTRFAYHFAASERIYSKALEYIANSDPLGDDKDSLHLLTKFTPTLLYLPGERSLDSYRLALFVKGSTGTYFTRAVEVRIFRGSGTDKQYGAGPTPAELKTVFESEQTMPLMKQAISSQLSSHQIKHEAFCDGCEEQIRDVRYRCRDCVDYDLCHRCYQEASKTHPGHILEPVYSPASADDPLVNPNKYLRENFAAVAYRFHDTAMDSIMQDFANDTDSRTAFRTHFSFGMMFPWLPRMGVDPPYWVGNLDCDFQPAASQVPHIRCMGLRLKSSDPVDAPPQSRPAGYRFAGQPLLGAIGEAQHMFGCIYGPHALTCPLPELAERAALAWALQLSTLAEDSEGNVETRSPVLRLRIPLPRGVNQEGMLDQNAAAPTGVWMLKMPMGEFEDYVDALPEIALFDDRELRPYDQEGEDQK